MSMGHNKYQLLQLGYYLVRDNVQQFSDALTSNLGRPAQENHL